jgi:hypothetical protein
MSNSTQSDEKLARRYAEFAVNNRWLFLIAVLVCTVFLGWYVKDMDIRNDPDTLLPPSNRYVATNLYGEQTFGFGNMMVVGMVVKEGDIYQPWFINHVMKAHEKLVKLPESRKENFISIAAGKVKYMGTDDNGLVFKPLLPREGISTKDEALAKQQLDFLRVGVETNPVMAPMLIYKVSTKDNKPCVVTEARYTTPECVAKGAFVIGDYTDDVKTMYFSWIRQLVADLDEFEQDSRMEVLVAGEPYFLAYMLYDLAKKWWLFAISLLIVMAVLIMEFKSWRGALFPLLGVGATIAMTLGAMGITQYKLTTMMVLTPMLLLAIGIGHSVQIMRRMLQEQSRIGDPKQAAVTAIEHTIIPATLSIVTDAVGFATLATVDISFFKDYAYFGMFGMFTLLITTTTLIPLLLTWFPESKVEDCEPRGWELAVGQFNTRIITGPGKWVSVAIVAGILAWSVNYAGIYDSNIAAKDPDVAVLPGNERGINYARAAFKEHSITIQDITRLGEIMPGVISMSIPIRGKEPLKPECRGVSGEDKAKCHNSDEQGAQGIFNDAEVLADIEAFEEWLRKHPYIGFTGSYAQYVRLVNMLMTAEPGEKTDLKNLMIPTSAKLRAADPNDDRDANQMVQTYNGLLEIMTASGEMDSFVNTKSWNEGILLGFVNTMDPRATHQVVVDVQDYIEKHKNDAGFKKVHFGLRCGPFIPGKNAASPHVACDTGPQAQDGPSYVKPALGGFLGATEATREVAVENFVLSPMQTGLAVFIISVLMFRNVIVPALLMILLGVTLFAQYGLGGYFTAIENWSGNLAFHTQVVLSISMGLGIDYGIYIVSRLREEMAASGGDWIKSLEATLCSTGSAVLVSVVVLLGSFIPLLATELANTWSLGIYIGQALIIDVITALTILPMLVWLFKPKYVFQPAG